MESTTPKLRTDDVEYNCFGAIVSHFLDNGAYTELTAEMVEKSNGFLSDRVSRALKVLEMRGYIENKEEKSPAKYKATAKLSGRVARDVWKEIINLQGENGYSSESIEPSDIREADEVAEVCADNRDPDQKGETDMRKSGRRENAFKKVKETVLELTKNGRRITVEEVIKKSGLSQPCVGSHMRTMAERGLIKSDKTAKPYVWSAVTPNSVPVLEPSRKDDSRDFKGDGKAEEITGDGAKGSGSEAFLEILASIRQGIIKHKAAAEMRKNAAEMDKESNQLISDGLERLENFAPWFGSITHIIEELGELKGKAP